MKIDVSFLWMDGGGYFTNIVVLPSISISISGIEGKQCFRVYFISELMKCLMIPLKSSGGFLKARSLIALFFPYLPCHPRLYCDAWHSLGIVLIHFFSTCICICIFSTKLRAPDKAVEAVVTALLTSAQRTKAAISLLSGEDNAWQDFRRRSSLIYISLSFSHNAPVVRRRPRSIWTVEIFVHVYRGVVVLLLRGKIIDSTFSKRRRYILVWIHCNVGAGDGSHWLRTFWSGGFWSISFM